MNGLRKRRGYAAAAAAGAGLALVLTACSSGDDDGGGGDATTDCSAFEEYGDLEGTQISVYTSIVAPEADQQISSYVPFEECTGAEVVYEGSREFEAQLPVRLAAGNPPDIAYVPQPGFLATIVADYPDAVVPAPQGVIDNVAEYFSEEWASYGTVDGTLYASPLGANAKSFVWYSPQFFEDNGYEIPETWDDLIALSDQIVEDYPDGTVKPWCVGIESGDATGWPATDWLEDMVLRTAGPDVYDQWYTHQIPFNDPQILEALQAAGEIVKNPDYVNGGLGDVSSIATAAWTEAGFGILDGTCAMHRAANFYAANWDEAVTVQEEPVDQGVFAFYLPSMDDTKPLLGGGEFVTGFADRPEVEAFRAYLASPEWANAKAEATPAGGWFSANNGLDPELIVSPVDQLAFELMTDDAYTFRFDGSDLMPGAVGADAFWKQMVAWIGQDQSDQETLDNIEAAWPAQ